MSLKYPPLEEHAEMGSESLIWSLAVQLGKDGVRRVIVDAAVGGSVQFWASPHRLACRMG